MIEKQFQCLKNVFLLLLFTTIFVADIAAQGFTSCDAPDILQFDFAQERRSLITGSSSSYAQGNVYRYSNVDGNNVLDAIVTIETISGGTLLDLDNTGEGYAHALQPTFKPNNHTASTPDAYVDFKIKFVNANTNLAVTVNKFFAFGVDIDGTSARREFQEFKFSGSSQYDFGSGAQTKISATNYPAGSAYDIRFEDITNTAANGIPIDVFDRMVRIFYQDVSEFKWRIGLTFDGSGDNERLFSLYFKCISNFVPAPYDFGDAPAPYSTLTTANGAKHIQNNGIYLGASLDIEHDGYPSATAGATAGTGDDGNGSDDEDGVTITGNFTSGSTKNITVVTKGAGLLNTWMDWNDDGDWSDAGEQVFTNRSLAQGTHTLSIQTPCVITSGTSFARFRYSTNSNLQVTGIATDGEVEDYQIILVSNAISSSATKSDYHNYGVSCNTSANGWINLSVTGGATPYTYSWSNGSTTEDLSNIIAGTYSVIVTGGNSCSTSLNVALAQPVVLVANATTTAHNTVVGGTAGAATVSVTGGASPYTYLWSNGRTTAALTGLTAGVYSLVVTDANGCTTTSVTTVTEPANCAGCVANDFQFEQYYLGNADGTPLTNTCNSGASINAYIWLKVIGQSGRYSLKVKYDLTVLNPTTGTSTTTHVENCLYEYVEIPRTLINLGSINWTCGNVLTISNFLMAWKQQVTLGCSFETPKCVCVPSTVVNAPLSVNYTYSYGCNNGTSVSFNFNATATGGSSPYTYTWNFGDGGTSTVANPTHVYANPGPYTATLTVKGADNVSSSKAYSLSFPTQLVAATSQTNVSIYGGADGAATVAPSGGTTPYNYSWNTIPTQTNPTAAGLAAGSYSVTVTDTKGCTVVKSVTITQPGELLLSVVSNTNVSCFGGNNGAITTATTGGVAPYTYLWNNGATTESLSGITADTYSVTVTDANGAVSTLSGIIVTQPTLLTATGSVTAHVSCKGGANGIAVAVATGGTIPYTYLWSNGTSSAIANNLVANTYSVTATDAKGCTATAVVTITEPAAALAASASVSTHVFCKSGNNGTASASANGGTSPYTYAWSNGVTTSSNNNLTAGNYTVTVTDNKGCTATALATVTEPAAHLAASTVVNSNVSCKSGNNGITTASATGGTAPYTYAWSNGITTASNSNLTAGNYTVTVTDNKGCTATTSATITEPAAHLAASTVVNSNVSCKSGNNGVTTASATGGTSAYTYAWSNGITTSSNSNLTAGNYTVTVTDNKGCTATTSATITEPAAHLAASTVVNSNVSCKSGNNGVTTASATGGTAPYTYAWSNGTTTASNSNLTAGSYTITITDSKGCTATASASITEPLAVLAASTSVTAHVSCKSGSNGAASVSVTGGTTPYAYVWSNGSATNTISNLIAQTYSVTITDNKGCTTTASVIITEPAAALAASSFVTTHVSCKSGNNGVAGVNTTGGTAPYSYLWGNGSTLSTITNVAAGTYSVTVTDTKGCTTTASVSVTEPTILTPSVTISNYNGSGVSCFGASNGSIDLTISGGITSYSYSWNNGATTQDVTGLGAGTYSVIVRDANNCSTTISATLTAPVSLSGATITSNYNGSGVSCAGATNGSIDLTANGGTVPYTYQWSNGATTQDVNNLGAGTYSVTITDGNGCTSPVSVTLIAPAALSHASVLSNYYGSNVSCKGSSNGSVDLTTSGGTVPYTYHWSNGATTQDISALAAGTYSVIYTDRNGCTETVNVVLTEPLLLSSSYTRSNYNGSNVSVNGGNDGSIDLTVNGGTAPYSYLWSNGVTTQDVSGLIAGTYNVTITDANGCTTVQSIQITEPASIVITNVSSNYHGKNISCNGANDGSINITVNGGASGYTYQWSNGATTEDVSGLTAGTYSVVVRDVNGGTANLTITLDQPAALSNAYAVSNYNGSSVSCHSASNGSIDLTVTGGIAPYTYAWNNAKTTQDISNLSAGVYSVTITDLNGCTSTANTTLIQPLALAQSIVISNYNGSNVSCQGATNGSINLSVSGGTSAYSYQWSNGAITQDISNLAAGTYSVIVTDINGCTITASATLTAPTALTRSTVLSNYNGSNVSCQGATNGSVDLTLSGGTTAYNYAWSNGATTQDINSLGAGTYSVTITDANGCTITTSVTLSAPAGLSRSTVASNYNGSGVSCQGATNGSIDLTVSGGTTAYTYAWSNGTTTQDINGLGAGTYSVTITDANGCTITTSVTLTAPAGLSRSTVASNYNGSGVSCQGATNGSIDLTVSGGTTAYTYAWSNGATTQDINSLGAGNYSVTITDANGCTITTLVTLSAPAGLSRSTVASNYNGSGVSCQGAVNGSIDLTVSGGTTAYTYAWNNGATTQDINSLGAGMYSVTITDANGCTITTSVTLTAPAGLSRSTVLSNYNGSNVSCQGATNGSVDLTVTGGTTPYSYVWNNGTTTQDANSLGAGTYSVTITDVNGCTITTLVTLTAPEGLSKSTVASNYNGSGVSCLGATNGAVDLTVNGGTSPYNYAWNNGTTTEDINNLGAGTYSVTITDVNGCTTTTSVILSAPAGLSRSTVASNYNGSNVSCQGATNGSVNLTVTGGTTPYNYAWNNGATTKDINSLGAGTYSVTITDVNGCSITTSLTLTAPAGLGQSTVSSNYNGSGVSCHGATNGSVDLSVNGGTAPYTYVWNNGTTTQDINALSAGTYSVTITDVNGCTITTSVTLTAPAGLSRSTVASNYNGSGVSCQGATNGSVNLTVTGGTTPYNYAWNNGANTEDINSLGAGTYSVTITDVNGCSVTTSVTLTAPAGLVQSTISSNYNGSGVSCNGSGNGYIDLMVNGGTTPYVYQWSNGATTQDVNNLSAGSYSVAVTDANGCTTSKAVTLIAPAPISQSTVISNYNGSGVSCAGATNGAINLTVNGGTVLYTYMWSTGATTQHINNLGAGTYSVTVTDANGCTITTSATLLAPATLSHATALSNYHGSNVSCNGSSDGSVDVTINGGTTPYTYNWSNGATTQDLNNLTAGSYSLTYTDNNGCSNQLNVTLVEPVVLTSSYTRSDYNGSNVSVNGANDGSINLTVTGGSTPYTYSWSNGATTEDISNLIAGTYNVTITDANGCTTVQSIQITQPSSVIINSVSSNYHGSNVSCRGATDGTIQLTVTGGTSPYIYSWSNGATTQNVSGLAAGTYSVLVTDLNGGNASLTIILTQPSQLINTYSVSNYNGRSVTCHNATDGAVNLTVNGGTAPYTYSWNNGITTQDLTNIGAGNYSVTVTDVNGCITTASPALIQPEVLANTYSVQNYNGAQVSCNGSTNGSIDLSVTGGTTPYLYNWSNGFAGQDITNLGAGTYSVIVTDVNGCTTSAVTTLVEPVVLSNTNTISNYNGVNVSCQGATDGSIDLNVTGGITPYTYSWSNTATVQDLTGIGAGTYSVVITDANGCTSAANVLLTQPTVVAASVVISQFNGSGVSCNGATDGAVNLTVTGGIVPYTFAWSNAAVTQDINNLSAGSYSVVVTDKNGCTIAASATLAQPAVLANSYTISNYNGSNVSCNGATDGNINLSITGGTSPYLYNWNTGSVNEDLTAIGIGTYSIIVTDANGCTTTASATLTQPPVMTSSYVVSDYHGNSVSCNGSSNGTIDLSIVGGTSPYSYNWNTVAVTEDLNNISAGIYTVTITDANGCTISTSAELIQPATLISSAAVSSDYHGQDVSCNGSINGSANLTANGGTEPFTYLWSNGTTKQQLTDVGAGTYQVTVTDVNGCTSTSSVTLAEPAVITSSIVITSNYNGQHVSCAGAADGSVNLTVSGGVTPYIYSWSNGSIAEDATGITSGTYTVMATDANGCTVTASVTLTGNNSMTANIQVTSDYHGQNISCYAATNGNANLTVGGGTTPYLYSWSNGSNNEDLAGVGVGTYSVTITDVNGCAITTSITLSEPEELTSSATVSSNYHGQSVSCNGATDGSVNLTVNGGTTPYNYQWSNGATTQQLSNIGAGTYTVTLTDVNGCISSASVTLNQPAALISSAVVASDYHGYGVSCNGASNGSVNLTVNGGTTPLTYTWSNGATTQNLVNVTAGTYSVTVKDANNCSTSASVTITQPEIFTATSKIDSDYHGAAVKCKDSQDGIISVAVAGGVNVSSYSWSNGATTAIVSNIGAGTYAVTVTDDNGCTASAEVIVSQPTVMAVDVMSLSSYNGYPVTCQGSHDGGVGTIVSGGTGAYTYSWSNGATTEFITNAGAGVYSVVVSDINGCTVSGSVTITQPDALNLVISAGTDYNGFNISCYGYSNGVANAVVTGGVSAYQYSWSTAETMESISNLVAGTYTLHILDANGCTRSGTVTINQPEQLVATVAATINYGEYGVSCFGRTDGAIEVTATAGSGGYYYYWNTGATTKSLSGLAAGTYSVTVTDKNECKATAHIEVKQPDELNVVATITSDYSGYGVSCNGAKDGKANVTVSGGTGVYSYSWSNGHSSSSPSDLGAGNYQVVITDGNGCTRSSSVNISQPEKLATDITAKLYNGSGVSCAGKNDGEINLTVNGGVTAYTFNWNNGFSNNQHLNNVPAGTYAVVVKDANQCTVVNQITLTAPAEIISEIIAVTNYNGHIVSCMDKKDGAIGLTLIGGTSPYHVQWNTGETAMSLTNLSVGTYSVLVTDNNNCTVVRSLSLSANPLPNVNAGADIHICNGDALTLKVNGAVTYTWMPGGETGSELTITPLHDITYAITGVDNNGCVNVDSVSVNVNELPDLTLSHKQEICKGETVELTASSTSTQGITYNWAPVNQTGNVIFVSPAATTTYSVYAMDANGCKSKIEMANIIVHSIPSASILEGASVGLCEGGSTSLTAQSDGQGVVYNWTHSGETTTIVNVSPAVPTTYTMNVTDIHGCKNTASVSIDVHEKPDANAGNNAAICKGESILLSGSGQGTYEWSTGSNASSVMVNPEETTTYMLIVKNGHGCTDTSHITVTVNEVPKAAFSADSTTVFANSPIQFTDSSIVNNGVWNWNFGDGNSGSVQDPQHAYAHIGNYTVMLTVTNDKGCQHTTSLDITVISGIKIPNIFTPNGDGINDLFAVTTSGEFEFSITIYDRWGLQMFEGGSSVDSWDGNTPLGLPASEGTYYYIIKAKFNDSSIPTEYKGYFSLTR